MILQTFALAIIIKAHSLLQEIIFNNSDMTRKGADIYNLFWKPVEGQQNKHECKRCGLHRTQRVKSGYSNLKDHLNAEHPDWPDIMKVFYAEGKGPMDSYVAQISSKAKTIYGWMEWTLMDNNAFCFCEGKLTRKYSTLPDLSSETLMKYVKLTADKVRDKVTVILPESFGLVIDGWSQGSNHYSGMFASFTKNGLAQNVMLSCNVAEDISDDTEFDEALDEDEKYYGFTANDWFDIIVEVMYEYEFEINIDSISTHVEFISADNCSTNQSLSRKTGMFQHESAFFRPYIC